MGVETDYVMANEAMYEQVWESNNPSSDFNGIYGKGSDPISLSALYGCVSGTSVDMGIVDEYQTIQVTNDGEKSIIKVPDRIKDALATINDSNVDKYFSEWASTEDFMITGWDKDIATDFMTSLSCYIRENPRKDLLMCCCV